MAVWEQNLSVKYRNYLRLAFINRENGVIKSDWDLRGFLNGIELIGLK